jgi:phosphatidylglycerol:prolipoprotein diacylglycerol transferase
MYPDLFTIGPFELPFSLPLFGRVIGPITLHSFGLMAMLGFLIPTLIMRREFSHKKMDPELANNIVVAAIIGGFIGARLYYIIEHWQDFLLHPKDYIISGAGLVWYGGFFGGALAVIWLLKHYKVSFWKAADVVGPQLLLGQAFGRMGCLLAADGDYGPPSDLPWAMAFPKGVVPTDVPVHPTPLYEIILLLTFFTILWKIRHRVFPDGTFFGMYFIAVGSGRFITEFWRTTPKLAFGWMSLAQMISIGMIVAGGVIIYWRKRQHEQHGLQAQRAKHPVAN